MGGLELQKQLQSQSFQLPIIVMTLKGDMETAVRAMKAGAVDFIEKPFHDEGLLDAINAALALPGVRPMIAEASRLPRGSQGCLRANARCSTGSSPGA
jgi:FixJ family two-component response regulator